LSLAQLHRACKQSAAVDTPIVDLVTVVNLPYQRILVFTLMATLKAAALRGIRIQLLDKQRLPCLDDYSSLYLFMLRSTWRIASAQVLTYA